MKIVYISHSRIPSRNANSIHVMNICHELALAGHEVVLLAPDWDNTEEVTDVFSFYGVDDCFSIQKLWFPQRVPGSSTIYGLTVGKALKKLKPDLVIGRSVYGCVIAAISGLKVVYDSHAPIWEGGKLPLYLFRKMVRQPSFRKLVVNSNALKKIYMGSDIFKGTGYDPADIEVAHNGARSYALSDRASLPGDGQKIKVGYFGHLYKGRGMEIIAGLASRVQDADFYIGGGEDSDIAFWKSSIQNENVYFLGYIPHAEVYKYRNSCDILLAPYQKVAAPDQAAGNQSPYMNPIKILEYMSSQKAIIASDLPTIREVLNEKNAILVDCENVEQWAAAVRRLSGDERERRAIAEKAYQDFSANYTWESRARKLITDHGTNFGS